VKYKKNEAACSIFTKKRDSFLTSKGRELNNPIFNICLMEISYNNSRCRTVEGKWNV
jgi:hypothetical protein